jgi:hypothetical protein
MGRRFSSIFGFGEPLFGFAKLPLEVSNSSLEQAEVALGGEVQHARNALHALVEGTLCAAAKTKALHHQLLNLGVAHPLHDPRVLEKAEQAILGLGHGGEAG